jgi:cell division septation protein DedD
MERKPLPKIKRTAKRKGEEKTPSVQEEQEKPPVQKAQNEQLSLEVNPPTKEDVDGPLQEKIVSNGPEENTWILTLKWVTKLLLSAVFLVWIFVLGVLVGRGSVMPKSAQVLETPKIRQTQAAFSVGPGTSEAQDEEVYQEAYNPVVGTGGQLSGAYAPLERRGYDFRDNLEPDTQPGAITQAPSSPPQEADISTPSPEAAITPDSAPSPEETRVANNSDLGNNPSPQIASTPVAEIDPGYWPAEPQGTGAYTVQVGAPTSPDDAKAMVEKYRDKGFDAYYYFNGRGRYPTRVGRYETMAQAQEARNSLEKAGAREPYVSKLNV